MPEPFSHTNGLALDAKQIQQQHLSLKQRQGLEFLSLSRLELETALNEILQTNPFIEAEEYYEENRDIQDLQSREEKRTEDESLYEAEIYENSESWSDELPLPEDIPEEEGHYEGDPGSDTVLPDEFSGSSSNGSAEDFLLYTPADERPLSSILQSELNLLSGIKEEIRSAAESIVFNLDDDGMLRTPLEDLAMSSGCSMEEMSEALRVVQQFDPPGVGARSIQECLLLQLERRGEKTPLFEKLLSDMFEDLKNNRLEHIAQKLDISMEELKEMFQKLRPLNLVPVTESAPSANIIVPEVEILSDGAGGFTARLLKERRTYKLSHLAEYANDAGTDFAAKVKEGKNLLEALEFRKGTILRMAEMLIDVQREFLEYGPEKLRPFTMKQGAEYLNFKSESTISRAAASKYVKTPYGIFPFKYFFTAGYVSHEGQEVSRTADMELLKKLVSEEDKKHPLSDDKLSQLLNQAGHPVARRTVAKYRDLMNIPSSSLRKEHF